MSHLRTQKNISDKPRLLSNHPTQSTIIFDLDGTLLNGNHEISTVNAHALYDLRKRGFHLVIATGRHIKDIRCFIDQLGGNISAITSNGANIHNRKGELIYSQTLKADVGEKLIPMATQFGIHTNVYTTDEWLVFQPRASLLVAHKGSEFAYRQTKCAEVINATALKILFHGNHLLLQAFKEEIEAKHDLQINLTFSDDHYLEVMAEYVSKGHALKVLLKNEGLPFDQTLAFCDGMNDVELLRAVAHPVVMQNASLALQQLFPDAARALNNREDGVARFLWDHVL